MTVSGVPNIRVILREADTENLLVDVPNLTVKIVQDSSYNVNTVQPVTVTLFSGSYNRFADVALLAYTASYISGSSISASYAQTASYALNAAGGSGFPFSGSAVITGSLLVSQSGITVTGSVNVTDNVTVNGSISASSLTGSINLNTVTQNYPFQIPFISESKLSVDTGPHLVFNPVSHVLQISGGVGTFGGTAQLSPRGLVINSGSEVGSVALNHYGVFTRHDGNVIGITARPVSSSPYIANTTNPSIFVTSGSELGSAYTPIEFQGSGSHTDGRVTVTTPLVAKQSVEVTGSTTVTEFVKTNEYKLNAGTVSIIFTGSINTGIFGTTEYIYPYISTTQYSGMTVEYLAQRPGACRMGIIMASWLNTASVTFTDISTTDIGDTSDITFRFLSSSNELRLRVNSDGSGSGAWTVQSLFKLFPNLNP